MLKDENSTEMFSYLVTALTIHSLAPRAVVLLALRSYEAKNERRKSGENGRKMPMKLQMEKKREEERGGSKKRKKHNKQVQS